MRLQGEYGRSIIFEVLCWRNTHIDISRRLLPLFKNARASIALEMQSFLDHAICCSVSYLEDRRGDGKFAEMIRVCSAERGHRIQLFSGVIAQPVLVSIMVETLSLPDIFCCRGSLENVCPMPWNNS